MFAYVPYYINVLKFYIATLFCYFMYSLTHGGRCRDGAWPHSPFGSVSEDSSVQASRQSLFPSQVNPYNTHRLASAMNFVAFQEVSTLGYL